MAGRHDPYHDPSPSALIQSPSCAVNVNDRVLTFAIIAQVWTAGDDHREMDALLIAPAVALSFAVTLILGKALLHVLIAMMERAARSAQ
jgi:hypothetical protein